MRFCMIDRGVGFAALTTGSVATLLKEVLAVANGSPSSAVEMEDDLTLLRNDKR